MTFDHPAPGTPSRGGSSSPPRSPLGDISNVPSVHPLAAVPPPPKRRGRPCGLKNFQKYSHAPRRAASGRRSPPLPVRSVTPSPPLPETALPPAVPPLLILNRHYPHRPIPHQQSYARQLPSLLPLLNILCYPHTRQRRYPLLSLPHQ